MSGILPRVIKRNSRLFVRVALSLMLAIVLFGSARPQPGIAAPAPSRPATPYTTTISSGDISAAIPDNGSVTSSRTGNFPNTIVTGVRVKVRLNHTYDHDLRLSVIAPDGATIILSDQNGGSGNNYGSGAQSCSGTFTTFDVSAATAISAGSAPFAGTYRPDQDLRNLDGHSADGSWSFRAEDLVGNDVGTLYCWQVELDLFPLVSISGKTFADVNLDGALQAGDTGVAGWQLSLYRYMCGLGCTLQRVTTTTSDANGDYSFDNLTPGGFPPLFTGIYVVSATPPAGWSATTPGESTQTITQRTNNNGVSNVNFGAGRADLRVVVTDSPDPVSPGATLHYYYTVYNDGPTDATSVVITNTPPAQFTGSIFGGWSSGTCAFVGVQLVCQLNRLSPGGSAAYDAWGTVDATLPDGTVIQDSVTANSKYIADANPGNNTIVVEQTTVRRIADLQVTKTGPASAFIGEDITYQLSLKNNGPDPVATSVTLTDTVPANTVFKSFSAPAGWVCSTPSAGGTGPISCVFPASILMPFVGTANFSLIVTARADLAAGVVIANTAGVTSGTYDGNLANNGASTTTRLAGKADLRTSQTVSANPVIAGTDLTYQVTVLNGGPNEAGTVVFTDTVPVSMTFKSVTPAGGFACPTQPAAGGTGAIVCAGSGLGNGGTALFVLVFTVDPLVRDNTTLINNATAAGDSYDVAPGNNASSLAVLVQNRADLVLTVSASPDPVIAGSILRYNISIVNSGPSVAPNVVFTDMLPISGTLVSAITNRGSCGAGNPVICTIGDMHPGFASGTAFIVLDVLLAANSPDSQFAFNRGEVTSDTTDPDMTNNLVDTSTHVIARSDLRMSMSDSPDPVIAGANLTYTIQITNGGPSNAPGVVVSDTLPVSSSLVAASVPGGTCILAGDVICTVGALVVGQSMQVIVVARINSDVSDGSTLTNVSRVGSLALDDNTGNNGASVSTLVLRRHDLVITKTGMPDPVEAGGRLTYTIAYVNNGPSDAFNVTISDTLPLYTSYFTVSSTAADCAGGRVISCTVGTLPYGFGGLVVVSVDVDAAAPDRLTITNTAAITSSSIDLNYPNNWDSTPTQLRGWADLGMSKTDAPDPAPAGTVVTYTLVVTNAGPSRALDVVITDPLPYNETLLSGSFVTVETTTTRWQAFSNTPAVTSTATLTGSAWLTSTSGLTQTALVSVTSVVSSSLGVTTTTTFTATNWRTGFCTGALTATCALGRMLAGDAVTVTLAAAIDITPPPLTIVTNTATVTALTSDPVTANNSASAITRIIPQADLAVVKRGRPDPAAAGTNLTYTLVVTNYGPHAAQNIQLLDPIPAGTSFITVSAPTAWACALPVPNTTVVCVTPVLAVGAVSSIEIYLLIDPAGVDGARVVNTVSISSDTADIAPGNNVYTATTLLMSRPDLSIIKTGTPEVVVAGTNLTYTLQISNAGPSKATVVRMTDLLSPTAMSLVNVSTTVGACSGTTNFICNYGTLQPGALATTTIAVFVKPGVRGTLSNTASVFSNEADPFTDNNISSMASTVIGLVDLQVTQSDNPDPVVAGKPVTYTVVVTNAGPSTANGVTMAEALPWYYSVSSITLTQGFCTLAGTLTCNLGSLTPNTGAVVTVTMLVDPAARDIVTSTLSATAVETDTNNLNDTTVETTTVLVLTDLAISKRAGADPVIAGTTLTYTLIISNAGPSAALATVVTDTLPAGTTLSGYLSPQGSCTGTIQVVCDIGTVQPSQPITVLLFAAVDPAWRTALHNDVIAVSIDPDTDPTNNTAATDTAVTALADVSVRKTASNAGVTLTYIVSAQNAGPSTATGVALTDTLPAGMVVTDLHTSQGFCAGLTIVACMLDTLPPNTTASVTITAVISPAMPGTYTNTALVGAIETDPDLANNSAQASTHIYGTYLPLILHRYVPGPDLIVTHIDATPANVTVVVRNVGDRPVASTFWVDFYVNPNPVPVKVNDRADDGRSSQYIVWGVTESALPIQPGGTLTLTYGDRYMFGPLTKFTPGTMAVGALVYAQADSASENSWFGGVLENHEMVGGLYNNIYGPVAVVPGNAPVTPQAPASSSVPSGTLPPRRQR
ncbi:MAG: DUF11 domain-containing protein [Chloroflexi bacterium]|nr:DUF11 domain-containing protein [Chloroflexota bacterium]